MNQNKIENEFKLSGTINNQLKYSDVRTKDASLQKLLRALEVAGITYEMPVRIKNKDEYFDTKDSYLSTIGASMRIREVDNSEYFITLKQKTESEQNANSLIRKEFEVPTNKRDANTNLKQLFSNSFNRNGDDLISKVVILNERHQVPIETNQGKYLLCFDKYSFYSSTTNSQSEDYYEIEIESTKITQEKDTQLQQLLGILNLFDYKLGFDSKFKKALKWLINPITFEDKQFLVFDVVQYSLKPPLEQKTIISSFFYMVERMLDKYKLLDDSLKIPTGDGLILSFDKEYNIFPFLSDIYGTVERQNEQHTKERKLCFRTAVHYGPIFEYQDINGNINYAGDGINMVSRIIGKSNDWQVLVSEQWYSLMRTMGHSVDAFSDPWPIEVKHGIELTVRNYYNRQSKVGTPQ